MTTPGSMAAEGWERLRLIAPFGVRAVFVLADEAVAMVADYDALRAEVDYYRLAYRQSGAVDHHDFMALCGVVGDGRAASAGLVRQYDVVTVTSDAVESA